MDHQLAVDLADAKRSQATGARMVGKGKPEGWPTLALGLDKEADAWAAFAARLPVPMAGTFRLAG